MNPDQAAIFVFDSPEPAHVTVYPDLDGARESLESLDVTGDGYEPAFTATGQVIRLAPSEHLFATFEVTEQVDPERLQDLLRSARGPSHLADDPSAYAEEWMRLDELDAQRPPFVPQRVWSWYRSKRSASRKRGS